MRMCLLLLLHLFSVGIFCQIQTDTIDRSTFRNNHIAANAAYLENINDTSKLIYVATLKIKASEKQKLYIEKIYNAVEGSAKDLGADLYTASFSLTNEVNIKLYYGGNEISDTNKKRKMKGMIYLFNREKEGKAIYIDGASTSVAEEKLWE